MSPPLTPPSGPAPSPAIVGIDAYKVPRHTAPIDLRLDGNEGLAPPRALLGRLAEADPATVLRTYPSRRELERLLAERAGIDPSRVIVTSGGDDALDRACRSFLAPGRDVVMPEPTFEMLRRYAQWAGGRVISVPWGVDAYPTDAVIEALTPTTTAIMVVSPNNPTGGVISAEDLVRLSAAAPGAAILLDLAYVEFADVDLTAQALTLPNVLVFRTMSKAWGLAGLRVGYALGPAEWIGWLAAAGNPYTVSGPSLLLATERLNTGEGDVATFAARVRIERESLTETLTAHGVSPRPSQGNFVFATTPRAGWLRDACAGLGIGIRAWPGHPVLGEAVRITCPGSEGDHDRLTHALTTALTPEAILFDMDGVLADVSQSYRAAIRATCAHFGVQLGPDEIGKAKDAGGANNDWVLTRRLLGGHGVDVPLDQVTAVFEALYHGHDGIPGLKHRELLMLPAATLRALADRFPLAVVTGRPHKDAVEFLEAHGLTDCFLTLVCMEDGPPKPDPTPVRVALQRLGVQRAWMLGDTVDDVRAARSAGVIPLGVVAPGTDADHAREHLTAAGAARVLLDPIDLLELLP
jgi:histidinol-phosphate aminotransferase